MITGNVVMLSEDEATRIYCVLRQLVLKDGATKAGMKRLKALEILDIYNELRTYVNTLEEDE